MSHPDVIPVFITKHLFSSNPQSVLFIQGRYKSKQIIRRLCDRYHKCQAKQTGAASHDVLFETNASLSSAPAAAEIKPNQ